MFDYKGINFLSGHKKLKDWLGGLNFGSGSGAVNRSNTPRGFSASIGSMEGQAGGGDPIREAHQMRQQASSRFQQLQAEHQMRRAGGQMGPESQALEPESQADVERAAGGVRGEIENVMSQLGMQGVSGAGRAAGMWGGGIGMQGGGPVRNPVAGLNGDGWSAGNSSQPMQTSDIHETMSRLMKHHKGIDFSQMFGGW